MHTLLPRVCTPVCVPDWAAETRGPLVPDTGGDVRDTVLSGGDYPTQDLP